ncbi:MAG: hypothetical protein M3533_15515, partial [Actinomycetota bacterium]|nr:hypothetical protein [Actinomycetota bacterium]
YSTKVLEDPSASAANAEEQLQGVDLLLLTPSLSEETQEGFLRAIEAAPAASDVPVLTLSTAPQDELNDRTGMVPWPTPLEDLGRTIEAALVSVPSGEPGGVERLPSKPAGHGGAAARGGVRMTGAQSERYHDLCVRLPADEDAASALLREVLAEGESRGWRLISAIKRPEADVLLVTWDTSGSFSG